MTIDQFFQILFEQVGQSGIFCVLLVVVGYYFKQDIKDYKTEAKEREKTLFGQIDKYNEQLDNCILTLDKMQKNLDTLNTKMDEILEKEK